MGEERKVIRKPQQKRSKAMAEKILDTAMKLFCEKGYYHTTTNEIAKEAGVSIGSLYAYYRDKDTIFLEILRRYHESFLTVFEEISSEVNQALYEQDRRAWLRTLLHELVKLHLPVKTLNRELKGLYYTKADVRKVMDQQTERIQAETCGILSKMADTLHLENLEITSMLIVDFISVLVDRIVFTEDLSERERDALIAAGIEFIFKALGP